MPLRICSYLRLIKQTAISMVLLLPCGPKGEDEGFDCWALQWLLRTVAIFSVLEDNEKHENGKQKLLCVTTQNTFSSVDRSTLYIGLSFGKSFLYELELKCF